MNMKKIEYLTETYMPIVLEGEDFSKFKNPSEIYFYIKPYVEQITTDDEDVTDVANLTENIADEIFKSYKVKMKGYCTSSHSKKSCPVKVNFRKMI